MMTGFGIGFIVLLVIILFFVMLILLVFWLARTVTTNNGSSQIKSGGHRSDALEILNQRYARGEISREEYQEMRSDLES